MPGSKYSKKQMIKFAEGGDIREEQLKQMLQDAREKGDDDAILEIEGDLMQMGAEGYMAGGMVGDPMMMGGGMVKRPGYRYGGKVKGYRRGMSVSSDGMGRGCGSAVSGKKFSGTF